MKKYYFVTESGGDLTPVLIEKYDIRVPAMHVTLGNKDYLDGEIDVHDVCGYYDKTGRIPKTSAVGPFQYVEVYEKIRAENPDSIIIHIGYSDILSSSHHNGVIAAEDFKNIYHVDSKNVSLGLGFLVVKAAQIVEENPDINPEELVKILEGHAEKVNFWFIPGNLKYLRAGGRVSNIKALFASLLQIKPLLQVLDGKLVATKNYRGSLSSVVLKMLTDFFTDVAKDLETVFIGYTYKIDSDLGKAMDALVRGFGVKNLFWFQAGAVITTHAGPGGIGIAAIEKA